MRSDSRVFSVSRDGLCVSLSTIVDAHATIFRFTVQKLHLMHGLAALTTFTDDQSYSL
jgi:hypothetical protein